MYRGIIKDLDIPKPREVKGYWCKVQGKHYIVFDDAEYDNCACVNENYQPAISGFVEVLPSSLAMSTGIEDKNGVEIFGSFPVDGVMSEGGSDIKILKEGFEKDAIGKVFYNKHFTGFCLAAVDGSYLTIMSGQGGWYEVLPKPEKMSLDEATRLQEEDGE